MKLTNCVQLDPDKAGYAVLCQGRVLCYSPVAFHGSVSACYLAVQEYAGALQAQVAMLSSGECPPKAPAAGRKPDALAGIACHEAAPSAPVATSLSAADLRAGPGLGLPKLNGAYSRHWLGPAPFSDN